MASILLLHILNVTVHVLKYAISGTVILVIIIYDFIIILEIIFFYWQSVFCECIRDWEREPLYFFTAPILMSVTLKFK